MMPPRLYKYEPFNELTLRNLKTQSIYFSSPKNFNDPYDCALTAPIQLPSTEELRLIREHYLSLKDDVPDEVRENLKNLTDDQLLKIFESTGSSIMESLGEEEKGVSCFSETNDNLVMWSHYGGRYKGFCLEFDTAFAPLTKARKVEYVDKVPTIMLSDLMLEKGADHFLKLLLTKSKAWEYENEWRVLHKEAGTLFSYEPEALTGIYFGPEIAQENLEIIALIMLGQNPGVKFYQGSRSAVEFKVEFKEVNYTPHVEAKRLGLI